MDIEEMEKEISSLEASNETLNNQLDDLKNAETYFKTMKYYLNYSKGKISKAYSYYANSYVSDNKKEEKRIHLCFTDSVRFLRNKTEKITDFIEGRLKDEQQKIIDRIEENKNTIKYYYKRIEEYESEY